MIKLVPCIILICYLIYSCDCGILPPIQIAEQTLITALLNGYNKNVRPDSEVSVDITATISQIVAIDEKQQIMTSSSFISQTWYDDRLSWAPNVSNYNIQVLMLPVKSLWIPDTMILNSADTSGYFIISDYSLASVYYTGQVYMILPALTIKTRCNMIVRYFPFDRQMCSINLTSWAQGYNRIAYTENSSSVLDTSEYNEHVLWTLTDTDVIVIKANDRAPFEDTFNDIISIQLFIRRKPLFFMMNGIFACLVLNCVTLISFMLPFATQISLCMICFMTYSVYSLNFVNLFPQQSDYLMMITLYFLFSIGWTLLSMAWFVVCNYFITKAEMPKPLYVFCGLLQKVFCCCLPPPKKDEKTDKNKDAIVENGEFKKSGNKESADAANSRLVHSIPYQEPFSSRPSRNIKLPSLDRQQHSSTAETEFSPIEPTNFTSFETAAGGSMIERKEQAKLKCNLCDRCESCQADKDKEKEKEKNKKDIEARSNALNYLVLLCVFLFMLASNLALWLSMSS